MHAHRTHLEAEPVVGAEDGGGGAAAGGEGREALVVLAVHLGVGREEARGRDAQVVAQVRVPRRHQPPARLVRHHLLPSSSLLLL